MKKPTFEEIFGDKDFEAAESTVSSAIGLFEEAIAVDDVLEAHEKIISIGTLLHTEKKTNDIASAKRTIEGAIWALRKKTGKRHRDLTIRLEEAEKVLDKELEERGK